MLAKKVFAFYLWFLGQEIFADDASTSSDVQPEKIKFTVYSREDMNGTFELKDYHKTKNISFLIHGFQDSEEGSFMTLLKDAFLPRDDCTIIQVDWSFYSGKSLRDYPTSAANAVEVAPIVADYIKKSHLNLKNVVIIGFSLGAQISGITGKNLAPGKVPKIIAFDPASVKFRSFPSNRRLSSTDARIVEVFHTSGDGLGYGEPIGTRDFYPNGGECPQPGCSNNPLRRPLSCSHNRAYLYYAEALRHPNGEFYGVKCDSEHSFRKNLCEVDGPGAVLKIANENFDQEIKGKFYFHTKDKHPFLIPINWDNPAGK